MATIVYSEQERDFVRGFVYRNPRYFNAPLGSPDKVILVGNWPRIRAAYEALGIEVETVERGTVLRKPGKLSAPAQTAPTPPPPVKPSDELKVGKGPGGRIFIKDGKFMHSGPYDSEEQAEHALAELRAKAAPAE